MLDTAGAHGTAVTGKRSLLGCQFNQQVAALTAAAACAEDAIEQMGQQLYDNAVFLPLRKAFVALCITGNEVRARSLAWIWEV